MVIVGDHHHLHKSLLIMCVSVWSNDKRLKATRGEQKCWRHLRLKRVCCFRAHKKGEKTIRERMETRIPRDWPQKQHNESRECFVGARLRLLHLFLGWGVARYIDDDDDDDDANDGRRRERSTHALYKIKFFLFYCHPMRSVVLALTPIEHCECVCKNARRKKEIWVSFCHPCRESSPESHALYSAEIPNPLLPALYVSAKCMCRSVPCLPHFFSRNNFQPACVMKKCIMAHFGVFIFFPFSLSLLFHFSL